MVASSNTYLSNIGELLSGEFDNRQQALAEPAWYVHLKLWHRRVRLFESDSLAFFIEQVSIASGQAPYRQRLIRLQEVDGQFIGQYYGFKQPLRFQGGAIEPDRLQAISREDLVKLPSCLVRIQPNSAGFSARMPPECLCSFEYQGRQTFVQLGFDIGFSAENEGKIQFLMYDKGIDKPSGKATWGALMGPFHLVKEKAFSL